MYFLLIFIAVKLGESAGRVVPGWEMGLIGRFVVTENFYLNKALRSSILVNKTHSRFTLL
jgi:hypothetical protein